jgi:methyltransferase-like protein
MLEVEQYMDFVRNRMFRQTLLVHREIRIERKIDWRRMTSFRFATPARPKDGEFDPRTEEPVRFEFGTDTMTTNIPLLKAALRALIEVWPQTVAFGDLLDQASAVVGRAPEPADSELLGEKLLAAHANDLVEISITKMPFVTTVSERPVAYPFARYQVGRNLPNVTNLRHESGGMDKLLGRVIALCDGAHDEAAMKAALLESALSGEFPVLDKGRPLTDPDTLRNVFESVTRPALERVADMAFLQA